MAESLTKTGKRAAGCAWAKNNRARANKNSTAWDDKNREKRRAISRQSKRRSRASGKPDTVSDAAREKRRTAAKLYRSINREKIAAAMRIYNKQRKAAVINAVPSWASSHAIASIYEEAERLTRETGIQHDVDHIVPLRSPLVCGLHWEANLQVLTALTNRMKSNRVWPDMP